jgi:biopolymer transport protein ExbB
VFSFEQLTLTNGVGGMLVVLSVTSWVVILYKSWWLMRISQDLPLGQAALQQAESPSQLFQAVRLVDRQAVLLPLLESAAHGPSERALLLSLRGVTDRLHWGQAWLAAAASAAPFLGLLGTVWGLQEALAALPDSGEGALSLWVTPLTQALRLTAWGLMVALPALISHQLMEQRIARLQQSIEDFADEWLIQGQSWAQA